jgi:hypothetical protein
MREHVPTEDESAEAVHRVVGETLVRAVRTTILTEHRPKGLRAEEPAMQLPPALA